MLLKKCTVASATFLLCITRYGNEWHWSTTPCEMRKNIHKVRILKDDLTPKSKVEATV